MKVKTKFLKVISDIHTPVGVYLKLRDLYSKIFLLESSDYKGSENSLSFICFESKAQISIDNNTLNTIINAKEVKKEIEPNKDVSHYLNDFINQFKVEQNDFDYPSNGLFGYISYDSVKYFDSISISNPKEINIPDILYDAFKYVIVFNHYNNELIIFEHLYGDDNKSEIDKIKNIVLGKPVNPFSFKKSKEEQTNVSDKEFKKLVDRGINHCKLGDVFQIVLSKRFYQDFQGDEFQVYRALRSINPSPYLFYFDYGSFKIFGSSPEAQIVIKNNKATIYPIAGTFKRTGDDEFDKKEAEKLSNDIKENSEHVMLVDLARNDLSKVSKNVEVERFKDIQFYSHVIHLVSKVSGNIKSDKKIDLISGTFPAGTLSGAPKHKAMQLIEEHENISREFYGGAIGFMGFNGDFNHAIIIRSFLSKNRRLFYQAGAGIVFKSNPDSENQEVYNKIEALRKAIKIAEKI
ncbi:MAG: chorismate-binding protein [Bacteroidota bacterium]|nr:chorismate-binding protein [Bacteroidota bacterium]